MALRESKNRVLVESSAIRKLHRAWPKRDRRYAELNDFRRTLLVAEVRNRAQRVVEAVGEISGADHERELNNLTFVVILAQLLERTGADRGSTAGDPLGVKNRGLLFFVEE
jgi:hypothetical protein